MRVNFWASANPQIQLGYFSTNRLTFTNGSASASTPIQAAFSANDNPVVRAFLNGYQSTSNEVQIAAIPSNLQTTNLTIRINIGPNTNISAVWVSWVAFSTASASFTAYGGSLAKNSFTGQASSDVSGSLYQNVYLLYGLASLSLKNSAPLALTCQINNFQLAVNANGNLDSFGLIYIVAGNAPSQLCAQCGAASYAYTNSCLTACPLGTSLKTFPNGGNACLGTAITSAPTATATITSITTSTTSTAYAGTSSNNGASSSIASNGGSSYTNSQSATSSAQTQTVPQTSNTATQNNAAVTAQNVGTVTQNAGSTASTSQSSTQQSDISSSQSATTNTQSITASATRTCPTGAFFNGNECVCDVGYGYVNGQCLAYSAIPIPVIINLPQTVATTTTTQTTSTVTVSNPTTGTNNVSTSSNTNTNTVTSNANSNSITQTSISASSGPCPANSFNNGLGTCVCNTGYYFSNNACLQGTPCPANSTRTADGSCQCNSGLTNYNGFCSQCPPGSFFSSQTSGCVFVCGQNAAYNATSGACSCLPGFGLQNGQCAQCPNNYFLSNGYCVTCPVNSQLNPVTNNCDCSNGYYTNQNGVCTLKCATNEIYSADTQLCRCRSGLGRVNGVCTVCPDGSTASADGSACNVCGVNQQLSGGKCICITGYALNSDGICTLCSNLPNGFLINGLCSVCPNTMVYNGNQGCSCPPGKVLKGRLCASQCQAD